MSNSRLRRCFQNVARIRTRGVGWSLAGAGLTIFALTISVTPARAEYRVQVGDVLEVTVAGVADLRFRAPVQIDGSIALPLAGAVAVAGRPLTQIRAQIGAALANKTFRQRTPDGRENLVLIDPDEVMTTITDYRPIYVDGDVTKAGEYPYRPRITARQAVAVAGGYDITHFRMNNPYIESAELKTLYGTLWTDFARDQARIWRIKKELGEPSPISPAVLKDVPIARSAISDIVNTETAILQTREADYQREKDFLARGVRQGDDEIDVLAKQQKQEEQGYQADVDELRKVTDLFSKGSLISPRVTDSRRAVLLSATRKLQITAQLSVTKRQQEDLTRKLEKLDDTRRADLLRDLQETNVHINDVRIRLQGVTDKLHYTSLVRSQLVRGGASKPQIVIFRKGGEEPERIVASEDTELQPGDAVEVSLPYHDGPDLPLSR